MKKRPCECGCLFEEHEPVVISKIQGIGSTLYCKNCEKHKMWCYTYRPCSNLEYLEYLYDSSR
jgi:hypothetical protein